MDINSLTIGQVKELAALFDHSTKAEISHPYNLGKNYFLRTVTHHHTGKLVAVNQQELVLENAAWIADDGRLTDALESGDFNEVEMFPSGSKVIIGRASIIDAVEVQNIPTSQK